MKKFNKGICGKSVRFKVNIKQKENSESSSQKECFYIYLDYLNISVICTKIVFFYICLEI